MSNEWWDPSGLLRGLHAYNQIRVPLIRDGLISTGLVSEKKVNKTNVLEGLNILEVCHTNFRSLMCLISRP